MTDEQVAALIAGFDGSSLRRDGGWRVRQPDGEHAHTPDAGEALGACPGCHPAAHGGAMTDAEIRSLLARVFGDDEVKHRPVGRTENGGVLGGAGVVHRQADGRVRVLTGRPR